MDSEQRVRHRSGSQHDPTTKPRKGPGRQSPGQTKQRNLELLDKSLDMFLGNGFERTTIDGISAAVGMAKRTVYLRYGNKTRLFKAALQRAIEEWIVPVERLRAAETQDVEATLLKIGQILVENILSPAGVRLMRITNAESARMPEIGQFTYTQGTEPTIDYLTDLIRRRINVPDPQEAAVAFLYLVVGGPASMTAWGIVLERDEIDKHTRYCVRLFLHGLMDAKPGADSKRKGGLGKQSAQTSADEFNTRNPRSISELEAENRRLKLLLAESMLEINALKNEPRSLRG